jgi:RNA polymerase sigma-70 factor (ECF subfamily)
MPPTAEEEAAVVAAIRGGDEQAFLALVEQHQLALMRMARMWARDPILAEDLVQDCWLAALNGIHSFEGRASIKTWLCGILHNLVRARLRKDARLELGADEPAVPEGRFRPTDHRWAGHWADPPKSWGSPEHAMLSAELRARLEQEIAALPEPQRLVLVLRDVEGLDGEETCNILGLSDTNQRVLLHRARARLRAGLEAAYRRGDL